MILSTFRTSIGFFATVITKYTPFDLSKNTIEGIYDYLIISETIATSGQPTEKQFSLIKEEGYKTIINLAPHGAENSLPDEGALLQSLGLKYTHIPVDFKNPTNDDFKKFVASMEGALNEKTWVHCAANMRVSAFIYKYRLEVLKESKDRVQADLEKIWEPFGVWKNFVSKT